jgi:hypothetical protein
MLKVSILYVHVEYLTSILCFLFIWYILGMVIWYVFPVLVFCHKENLATPVSTGSNPLQRTLFVVRLEIPT